MTIAVAAEFPWGQWRNVISSLSGHFGGAVILAADTRWSYDRLPPEDMGRKLWTLGKQVGIVLAGDVWAGEEGIRRLREEGQDAAFKGARDVTDAAEQLFRDTYNAHVMNAHAGARPPCGPLYYLMGMVDAKGFTALIRFSSDSDFRPIFLTGVHAIGIPSAREAVRAVLIDRVGKLGANPQFTPDPLPWAMHVAGAIDDVIEAANEPSVGGRVQIVVGDSNGWKEIPMSFLPQGAECETPANWREGTHPVMGLKTAEDVGLRRLASCEVEELGIEQIA